jgi:hypothetical protein
MAIENNGGCAGVSSAEISGMWRNEYRRQLKRRAINGEEMLGGNGEMIMAAAMAMKKSV